MWRDRRHHAQTRPITSSLSECGEFGTPGVELAPRRSECGEIGTPGVELALVRRQRVWRDQLPAEPTRPHGASVANHFELARNVAAHRSASVERDLWSKRFQMDVSPVT